MANPPHKNHQQAKTKFTNQNEPKVGKQSPPMTSNNVSGGKPTMNLTTAQLTS